ncbi:sugar transferase [Candidatus Woesebacteria bacterium]|nr:MAG: sugar transferase [Candidatus Woesebacteria bacterium]
MNYENGKRLIDIAGSVFLIILFSPVIIITALLIKFTSEGPILADVPDRVGMNGKLFKFFKFRSMIPNAHQLLRTDPRFKKAFEEQQKKGNYKIENDPRITNIGRFIRKYSIDEVPQFFNVIKGDMSIVGPRPYYPEELKIQQKKFPMTKNLVKEMLSVKPGITGFWQVSGRSDVAFDKRIEMDAYYARKKSLILDILILLKTPWAMISGKGAV